MTNLYKFMGADIIDKLMMDETHIGIKFSHLHEYNDPGSDSNLLIVFYVQIMPDDLVMQLHRF